MLTTVLAVVTVAFPVEVMLVDAIAFVDISVAPAGCGMAEVKETADAKTLVEFLQSDPTVAAGPVAKMTAAHWYRIPSGAYCTTCNTVSRPPKAHIQAQKADSNLQDQPD